MISTKVGRVLSPANTPIDEADGFVNPAQNDVRYDYSGDGIEESFKQSCARLGRNQIEILYVHDIGEYTHGVVGNAPHREAFLGSGYERLVRLKEQGRIRAFGLGVNECEVCLDVMRHAGPLDVILLAGRLTLLDRVRALEARAAELGLPLATAALHFAIRHPAAASVLLGTAKPTSLQRSLEALAIPAPAGFEAAFA